MIIARHFRLASAAAWCLAAALATPAHAQTTPDSAAVAAIHDYLTACKADGGQLWGRTLCGPIILVDPENRRAVASVRPPDGVFARSGEVWQGVVPDSILLSNTSLTWDGTRWAFIRLPVPADRLTRALLLVHESFHRIEDDLALGGGDPMLPHLDERNGRFWLRMEIRALSAAVSGQGAAGHQAAIDALLFRARRQSLFPGTAVLEDSVERHEGMAEYTGTRLALTLIGAPLSSTAGAFKGFETRPSFVRSLGYGTGPGLGLLLDRYAPGWRKVAAGQSLAGMLATSLKFRAAPSLDEDAARRAAEYGAVQVAAEEDRREEERQLRLADYRKRLIDGPVLVLRQHRLMRSFNPNTLVAFGDQGTVYPTGSFSADWGSLGVDRDGALVSGDFQLLRVALPSDTSTRPLKGTGWSLTLAKGWKLVPGIRAGDLTVVDERGKP
ncbi:MAG: hypothetical protein ABJC74_09930 [Gemmatimonadota bacterium]